MGQVARVPQWRNDMKGLFMYGEFENCTTVTFHILDDSGHNMMRVQLWLP